MESMGNERFFHSINSKGFLFFFRFINIFEWKSSFYRVSLDFIYLLERPAPTN